jgi:class 3 adenylate cyclase
MAGAQKKSLDLPDERIEVEGIAADVVQIADAAISRNVFQPNAHCALGGARLSGNQRANRSCMAHHTGVLLEGNLHIEMDDGSTLDIGPNDVFDIPPGHDGWVISEKPMIGINWSGVRTWIPEPQTGERVLASVLFSDIVDSTSLASKLGDDAWRELLGRHNRLVRNQLDRYRGREVTTTGDGFLAAFDGAARAIRAALAIGQAVRTLGLEVRQGIHTAEVELVGDDVRGIAVHEAARIAGAAAAGEILVSSTTRAMAEGGEFGFVDRGSHELRGLSGTRQLFAVGS